MSAIEQNKIYVIAEMACSHDGKVALAKTIIDGAGRSGADAIQLQIWSLPCVMTPDHPVYKVCQDIEFSQAQWKDIAAYSKSQYPAMEMYCCVYEYQSLGFIETLGIAGYKLNSSDLSNPYVLDAVAQTGKKINLSIGASTLDEIQAGIERIRRKSKAPITLMYGYQNFPTTVSDIHLNYVQKITSRFGLPVGYQDHCDGEDPSGFWIPALAVGMGFSFLEKHITHNRALKGVDYQSALNPDEFGRFVGIVRELESAKGSGEERPFSADEIKYRKFQKKSIVAARPLKTGERIEEKDIRFLRAAELGLPPDQAGLILGRASRRNIAMHQLIQEEDVA